MNSIEDFRDYLIADVIQEIESMSREELVRNLVQIRTTPLEQMDAIELLKFRDQKNNT